MTPVPGFPFLLTVHVWGVWDRSSLRAGAGDFYVICLSARSCEILRPCEDPLRGGRLARRYDVTLRALERA